MMIILFAVFVLCPIRAVPLFPSLYSSKKAKLGPAHTDRENALLWQVDSENLQSASSFSYHIDIIL